MLAGSIHVSTHFSGIGCAEQAVECVHKAFQELLQSKVTAGAVANSSMLRFVSACDVSRSCQKLLMGRSEHVFGDIKDAFPTLEMPGPDRPVAERWAEAKRAVATIARECQSHVACRPPTVTVDISGSPCQPWSRAGQRRRLNDGRSDLVLLWAALMLKLEPPVVVHENVSGFPLSVLKDLMQEQYVIHHLPVNPCHVGFTCVSRPRVLFCDGKSVESVGRKYPDGLQVRPKLFQFRRWWTVHQRIVA